MLDDPYSSGKSSGGARCPCHYVGPEGRIICSSQYNTKCDVLGVLLGSASTWVIATRQFSPRSCNILKKLRPANNGSNSTHNASAPQIQLVFLFAPVTKYKYTERGSRHLSITSSAAPSLVLHTHQSHFNRTYSNNQRYQKCRIFEPVFRHNSRFYHR